MPWFIKTEHFTSKTNKLTSEVRKKYLNQHRHWVLNLKDSTSPVLIQDKSDINSYYVIMPMKI